MNLLYEINTHPIGLSKPANKTVKCYNDIDALSPNISGYRGNSKDPSPMEEGEKTVVSSPKGGLDKVIQPMIWWDQIWDVYSSWIVCAIRQGVEIQGLLRGVANLAK